ncbi:acetyltransferase [Lentzea tibetensis]|uniref:Acetyltransferase n=1 Tax=Lentzea tibetensis TaxID=2591470 RepID=A0A563ERY4_9PSEU|nr:DUF6640 family protein [Lentzea tibetensis]TWP50413.1 acetyltransferase [Lentzea tibetensis]
MSTAGRSTRRLVGKLLISAVAIAGPAGAIAADWNETHVFNPNWPPHAKFHNGQTIALGFELAAVSLWQLWGPGKRSRSAVRWATLFAGFYSATQVPAILFPGAEFTDPEFADRLPVVAGVQLNQLMPVFAVVAPLLAVGYRLAMPDGTPEAN